MNDLGSKMIKVYKKQYIKHGYSPASLGCPKGRQDLRFKSLSKYLKKGTLLDFGCGFGDLANYLKKENSDITYNGCDVVEDHLFADRSDLEESSIAPQALHIELLGVAHATHGLHGAVAGVECGLRSHHLRKVGLGTVLLAVVAEPGGLQVHQLGALCGCVPLG